MRQAAIERTGFKQNFHRNKISTGSRRAPGGSACASGEFQFAVE
jgi:hypothetical protein